MNADKIYIVQKHYYAGTAFIIDNVKAFTDRGTAEIYITLQPTPLREDARYEIDEIEVIGL